MQLILLQVFDYDWGLQDDFMGSAKLCLTTLELNRAQDMAIKLEDPQRANKDLGEIKLNVTLWPKTQEDKEQVRPFTQRHYIIFGLYCFLLFIVLIFKIKILLTRIYLPFKPCSRIVYLIKFIIISCVSTKTMLIFRSLLNRTNALVFFRFR